jgi:hypothetical protein
MSDHPYARVILKHPAFPQRKEEGNVREQMDSDLHHVG